MNLTDRILRNLTRNGPATAADVAEAVHENNGTVAAMLGKLAAAGRVRVWSRVRQGNAGAESTIYDAANG